MYGNNKREHYERMGQRIKIFMGKSGYSMMDFLNNMCDEHLSFYTEQGFTKKEAIILIKLPDRVRDFFGLQLTINVYNLYNQGKYDDFFKQIIDFIKQSDNEYTLETIEFVTEQLALGLKSIETPSVTEKLDEILKLDFIINKISNTINRDKIKSKEEIILKLKELSLLFFMDTQKVNGKDLAKLLSDNI